MARRAGEWGGYRPRAIEAREKESGHSTAGPSGSADAVAIDIVPGAEVIQSAPGIQQLDRQRRKPPAVPVKPGMRIDAVMGELDLTHLDVVHDHHGDAVRR